MVTSTGISIEYGRPAILQIDTLPVHETFEKRVAATPDAVAIISGLEEVTYADLDVRANRLARYLSSRGVSTGSIVAVLAERSINTIIALIAILKAGAAYAPLNPSDPRERLSSMLDDLRPSTILTVGTHPGLLSGGSTPIVDLMADRDAIAQESPEKTAVSVDPEFLAYIMYTSGSTGTPKGVCVPHRAIARLVCEPDYVTLDARERVLQYAPLSFDASTFEIWGALLNGARLVLAPPGLQSLAELGSLIQHHSVSTMWLTAGLFHQIVDRHIERLGSVRQLLAGGDVLSPDHVRRALAALPDCTIVNGYGPTENTTFTCCHRMTPGTEIGATVPIGMPIRGTHTYLLNDELREVSKGEPGELYAGGAGVACGYLNRPDLSAERFVADPFSNDTGAVMYKTGDLAKIRSDGTIEFLGRADQQIKIRGFRVEPGEIEAALFTQSAVLDAVVVAREGESERRLVAYVILRSPRPHASVLRAHLSAMLPGYMVPSTFIALEAFPLTANGKVDRNALPRADRLRPDLTNAYAEPRTDLECALANALRDAMSIDRVGIDDNFFDLGASSLELTIAHDALRRHFAAPFSIVTMFEHPNIRALASYLSGERVSQGLLSAQNRALRQREAALGRHRTGGAKARPI